METEDVALPVRYQERVIEGAPHAYFVYFVYCAGRVKIGRSIDVAGRLSQIATGSPFKPVLLLTVSGSLSAEKELHARFAEDRSHREWFRLSEHLRRYLTARLDPPGLAAFRKAEHDFLEAICPEPEVPYSPRKWKKPRKMCAHGNPMAKPCSKCTREAALRVYDELTRRLNQEGTP